jgi:hypothetical protein
VASRKWNVVSTGNDLDCSFHVYIRSIPHSLLYVASSECSQSYRSSSLQYLLVNDSDSAQSSVRSFIVSYCFCLSLRPGEALTIRGRLFKALP